MLVAGALGLGAVWRRLRLRSASEIDGVDPAAELRDKLAQSKLIESEPPDAEQVVVEEVLSEAESEPGTLDPVTRRRSVHERARSAMDDLR